MKYVVDTSVAFKWVVTEPDSDKAIRLRDDYRNGFQDLIAPDLFPTEIANALLIAERRGRIVPGMFPALLADVLKTCPQLHPAGPLLTRVVAIVASARVSVYDALYVALAEQEMCKLLTADDRLARSLPSHPIVLLPSLP